MTSICVIEPVLSALADSYNVDTEIDTSGAYSKRGRHVFIESRGQAGVVVINFETSIYELQHTGPVPTPADWKCRMPSHT